MNGEMASVVPSANIHDLLSCPRTGASIERCDDAYVSVGDPTLRFPIEGGVIRAFIPHDRVEVDVTLNMKAFYEANPFPNYDDVDNLGTLIQKSVERGFPEMLNRSILLNASVLEVGCGTGQLGNFLSICGRRVVSVDMCLNSLKLGQRFKESNGLTNITFAQMNLFRLPFHPASFDVVICTGVLHHTSDPFAGFQGLLRFVKPGGKIIIGLYGLYGRLKTRLRGMLDRSVGDRIAMFDPYIRQHRVEGDKRRAWIMDQYRNPHESFHTMDEVLHWFDKMDIRFVRAVPSTVFGSRFQLDYRYSLFEPESRGSFFDRLLSQLQQMRFDTEGGLFIMIGTKA